MSDKGSRTNGNSSLEVLSANLGLRRRHTRRVPPSIDFSPRWNNTMGGLLHVNGIHLSKTRHAEASAPGGIHVNPVIALYWRRLRDVWFVHDQLDNVFNSFFRQQLRYNEQ